MNMDKTPADSAALGCAGGGDAGRGRVEYRSFRNVAVAQSVRNGLSRTRLLLLCVPSRKLPLVVLKRWSCENEIHQRS